jgi:DnaJ-class molecular chaperone
MRNIEKETVYVTIPAGIDENETMTLDGKGHIVNDFRGDVKLEFQIENNTIFKRQGQDIVYTREISLKESLCGFSIEIQHLSGKMLNMNNIQNPTVVTPGYKKTVPHLGFQKGGHTGNLVIEFSVKFPDTLTEEQINVLRNIL